MFEILGQLDTLVFEILGQLGTLVFEILGQLGTLVFEILGQLGTLVFEIRTYTYTVHSELVAAITQALCPMYSIALTFTTTYCTVHMCIHRYSKHQWWCTRKTVNIMSPCVKYVCTYRSMCVTQQEPNSKQQSHSSFIF